MSGYPMIDALNAAPTTRETADHAELARVKAYVAHAKVLGQGAILVSTGDLETLLSEIAALRGEVERSLPSISFDGEHAISDHRRWLARQLLDSRLDDGEAYSVVAYHPAITDLRTTQAERQRDEAVGLLRRIVETPSAEYDDVKEADAIRAFLSNQGAE